MGISLGLWEEGEDRPFLFIKGICSKSFHFKPLFTHTRDIHPITLYASYLPVLRLLADLLQRQSNVTTDIHTPTILSYFFIFYQCLFFSHGAVCHQSQYPWDSQVIWKLQNPKEHLKSETLQTKSSVYTAAGQGVVIAQWGWSRPGRKGPWGSSVTCQRDAQHASWAKGEPWDL